MSKMIELKADRLKKRLKELKDRAAGYGKASLTVGFYDDAKYPDGTPVATVAAAHNFGAENLPKRPFFSDTIEENADKYAQGLASSFATRPPEQALARLGEKMVSDLQGKIENNSYPPDKPETVVRKQKAHDGMRHSLKTLEDTLQMRDSIGYSVNGQSPQYSQGGD